MSYRKLEPAFILVLLFAMVVAWLVTDVSGISDWLVTQSCGPRPSRGFGENGAETYLNYLDCVRGTGWQTSIVSGIVICAVILIVDAFWRRGQRSDN